MKKIPKVPTSAAGSFGEGRGNVSRTLRSASRRSKAQSLRYFWIFFFYSKKRTFFAFFVKLTRLGVGFLNRAGAEMGYSFDLKKCDEIIFFTVEKCQKYLKCPALPKGLDSEGLTYGQMSRLARSGHLLILVDGLDEAGGEAVGRPDEEEVRSRVREAARSENSPVLTGLEFVYGLLLGDIFRGSRVLCTGRQQQRSRALGT